MSAIRGTLFSFKGAPVVGQMFMSVIRLAVEIFTAVGI
jgi:hypothetical protein